MMQTVSEVTSNRSLGEGYGLLTLKAPKLARLLAPGQFVNVRCATEGFDPLLRRPFSPAGRRTDRGEIEIIYRVVGRGTRFLSLRRKGDPIDVVGPLGKGFSLLQEFRQIAIVGRGVGIAPLLFLSQRARELGVAVKAFLSVRSDAQGFITEVKERLRKCAISFYLSTDSSELVSDRLREALAVKHERFDMLYVCGSRRLLKAVDDISKKYEIPAQVSLESRMACGMGVCHGCVIELKGAKVGHYARVCVDGPVFNTREVMPDD